MSAFVSSRLLKNFTNQAKAVSAVDIVCLVEYRHQVRLCLMSACCMLCLMEISD